MFFRHKFVHCFRSGACSRSNIARHLLKILSSFFCAMYKSLICAGGKNLELRGEKLSVSHLEKDSSSPPSSPLGFIWEIINWDRNLQFHWPKKDQILHCRFLYWQIRWAPFGFFPLLNSSSLARRVLSWGLSPIPSSLAYPSFAPNPKTTLLSLSHELSSSKHLTRAPPPPD